MAALLSYTENISTVLALSSILFMFLALYRPGLRDWGTVNETQTGISNIHSNILLQNLRKIDISKKKMTYLPVSAIISPLRGWIQHSVPLSKLVADKKLHLSSEWNRLKKIFTGRLFVHFSDR